MFVYLLLLKNRGAFDLKNKVGIESSWSGGQRGLFESNSKVKDNNVFNVQFDIDQSDLCKAKLPAIHQQIQFEPETIDNKQQPCLEVRRLSLNDLKELDVTSVDQRHTKSMSDLTLTSDFFEDRTKINRSFPNNLKDENPEKTLTSVNEVINEEEFDLPGDLDRAHFMAEKLAAIR